MVDIGILIHHNRKKEKSFNENGIKNFRSIWDLKLPSEGELKNLVVLVGSNNSGKSNILRSLRIALEWFDDTILKSLPVRNPWFFNYTNKPSIIEVFLSLDSFESQRILSSLEGLEEIESIRLKVELFEDEGAIRWKLSEVQLFGYINKSVVELAEEFSKEVARHYGSKNPKKAQQQPIEVVRDDKIVLHEVFKAIVDTIGKHTNKVRYIHTGKDVYAYNGLDQISVPNQLMENIRWVCSSPLKRDFIKRLEIVKEANDYSRDASTIHYEHEDFPVEVFGSGSLSFDAIWASLLKAKCSHTSCIVLIEEPENHLHPELVRELAVLLEEVAEERKVQIFVVTHSPELVDALSDKSVVVFVKKSVGGPYGDPATIALPLKEEEEFSYLAIELGSRLFFANVLILVEGGDDECLLKYWINSSRKDLTNLRKYSVGIIPFAQSFQGKGLASLVKTLKEKLKLDVYVILDGDEKGKENRKQLEKEGFADITFNLSELDILSFIEPSKIEKAIQNACESLGIELGSNAKKKYNEYMDKIKTEIKKKEGKDAYNDLLNLLRDVSGISIPIIKNKVGLELIKLRPEVPAEVKGILSQIDLMLRR